MFLTGTAIFYYCLTLCISTPMAYLLHILSSFRKKFYTRRTTTTNMAQARNSITETFTIGNKINTEKA